MAMQGSLRNAIKWSYSANWGDKAFSALFSFVLAALLGPRDFGVLAIALIYIGFIQMFLEQGLVAALIQRKNLEPGHTNAVFWLDCSLSVVLMGLSVLLSHWWAAVNHAPQVATVITALSLCIPIEGLAIVQKALLSRAMDFKSLSIRSNISVLAGGAVGIGMAFAGCGIWSLVVQQITRDLVALVLMWRLSSWRPSMDFSGTHLWDLTGFSVSNFVGQLGVFAETYSGSILLGIFLGPEAVGLYRLAEKAVNTVLAALTSSIQSVSLPEFSRLQDNPEELRRSVLACIRLSSALSLPALAGLFSVSAPLIALVGAKWLLATNVLRIFCISGMFVSFASFTGPLLQALSKVRLAAALEWSRMAVSSSVLVAAWLIVRHGVPESQVVGIAIARLVSWAIILTPVFVFLLARSAHISLSELLSTVAPSGLASGAIVLAVFLLQHSGLSSRSGALSLLATEIAVGGMAGIPVLLLLDSELRGAVARSIKRIVAFRTLAREAA
jgi:PST family polysaccharide transporter